MSPHDPFGIEHPDSDVILPFDTLHPSRRSFLRIVGFGIAVAAIDGCARAPGSQVASPATGQPGVIPGRNYRIATTCGGCAAGCGVIATCRDGRPIKLEGSPQHPISGGGLCAVGQASVLSLYDSHRIDGPQRRGVASTWADADREIIAALSAARTAGGRVRLLSGTITSPSTRAWIRRFTVAFQDARHVTYDALSSASILDAHELTHGTRVLPRYRFDRAALIAAFDADFLGTWISPVEFAAGYASRRRPDGADGRMSRHWHLEPHMTLTGGCADERVRLAPWDISAALTALVAMLEAGHAKAALAGDAPWAPRLGRLADELLKSRGHALIVCGTNDTALQTLVNRANELVGAYGTTIDIANPSLQRAGNDRALIALRDELAQGAVDVLIIAGCNPVYDLPGKGGLGDAIRKAKLVVSCAAIPDETSTLAAWVCPEPHALESWNDAEPVSGVFSLTQPTTPPLRSARTLRETLARWSGETRTDRDLMREAWATDVHPRFPDRPPFSRLFNKAIHDGYVVLPPASSASPRFDAAKVAAPARRAPPAEGGFGLVLHPTISMLDGRHAHNPWLQELPDPVTRLAWESYATLAPKSAEAIGVVEGDVVRIDAGEGTAPLELPVHLLPGQHDRVVAVALGYGRIGTDRFSKVGPEWFEGAHTVESGATVGVNVAPLLAFVDGALRSEVRTVRITRTGAHVELATVQEYQSLEVPPNLASRVGEVREAVRTATFAEFAANPVLTLHEEPHHKGGLWPKDHEPEGARWGMVVDLTTCTGCSACVIACQSENNIPVVGRDEIRRHRDMSWMRIDRYVQGEGDDVEVARQPMMCQHCGNAPCEAVCPVLATVHSDDGLNQQVYNRCVGTRYCANTCPYKVRRFNWFDYPHEDALQNLGLNPDVTVRSRGVMEKCSLCVQRIREGGREATRSGEALKDGVVMTACEQSCPTKAITFGNLANPGSAVSKKAGGTRAYRVLEELNVEPAVRYLARIRNRET